MDWSSLPIHDSLECLIKSLLGDVAESVDFSDGSIGGIGGGGASQTSRARVRRRGDREDLRLFIKTNREGSQERTWDGMLHIFDKEVTFYGRIVPKLGAIDLDVLPKFVGFGRVRNDLHVVLHDFSDCFSVVPAVRFLPADRVSACLRGLARFHALSLGRGHLLEEFQDVLRDRVTAEENEPAMRLAFTNNMEAHLKLLAAVLEEKESLPCKVVIPDRVTSEVLSKLISYSPMMMRVFRAIRAPTGGGEGRDVLLHGDFHMWNVAVNPDASAIKMFDFQIVCRGPLGADLQHFLSQAPEPEQRKAMWKTWLEEYCSELNSHCQTRLTPSEVQQEYRKRSPIGLLLSLSFILPRFVGAGDREAVEAAKKIEDKAKVAALLHSCGQDFWKAIQWLFDCVDEYCFDQEGLNLIENILNERI